jgi:hypothetical protein
MRILTTGLTALALATVPAASATAAQPLPLHGTCKKAESVRKHVVKKHGKRAPGRDICKWGVVKKHGKTRPSTHRERVAYLGQLRALLHPRPYLALRGAARPAQAPAGTLSPVSAPTGIAACIVYRESRGNPQASNGTHFGIAQWSYSTWRAHHGPEMTGASDPRGASYQQQLQVLSRALAEVGSGDWSPYDGC